MASIAELQEKRQALYKQITDLADRQDDWTTEDEQRWDALNADYDANESEMTELESQERRAARVAELRRQQEEEYDETPPSERRHQRRMDQTCTEEHRELAFAATLRCVNGLGLRSEHEEACQRVGIDPFRPNAAKGQYEWALRHTKYGEPTGWISPNFAGGGMQRRQFEFRAQSVGTNSAGGFLVPEGFQYELERARLQFNTLRSVARVIQTDSGNDVPFPTVDDTGNTGRLLAENAAITATDITYGSVTLKAYKFSSDSVLVSEELMEDSAFNMAADVGSLLGERIGRIEASYFTTGTGSSQPQGLTVGATAGISFAGAAAITADELIDLQESMDAAYQDDPSVRWVFAQGTRKLIRKLKDADNQYLWQPGLRAGEPDLLLGKPYVISNNMPAATTGNVSVVYGCMSKFIIRDVRSMRMYRLDERYRDNDQTGFIAFMRSSSHAVDPGSAIRKGTQA